MTWGASAFGMTILDCGLCISLFTYLANELPRKNRQIDFLQIANPHGQRIRSNAAIVVGAEQYGLSETWIGGEYTAVRIPMKGQCDSLNVGTAAAILLYEALRQREAG